MPLSLMNKQIFATETKYLPHEKRNICHIKQILATLSKYLSHDKKTNPYTLVTTDKHLLLLTNTCLMSKYVPYYKNICHNK